MATKGFAMEITPSTGKFIYILWHIFAPIATPMCRIKEVFKFFKKGKRGRLTPSSAFPLFLP
jgi:hypothetical protein